MNKNKEFILHPSSVVGTLVAAVRAGRGASRASRATPFPLPRAKEMETLAFHPSSVDARARARRARIHRTRKETFFIVPSPSFRVHPSRRRYTERRLCAYLDAASRLRDRGHWCECRSFATTRRSVSSRAGSRHPGRRFHRRVSVLCVGPCRTRRLLSKYPNVRPIQSESVHPFHPSTRSST